MRILKIRRHEKLLKLWVEDEQGYYLTSSEYSYADIDRVEMARSSESLFGFGSSVHSDVEPEPSGEPKGEDARIAQWQQIAQEQKALIDQLLDTIAKISNAPMVVPVDRRY